MVAVFERQRPPTPAFLKYRVAMDSVLSSNSGTCGWFEADVRERHSYLLFQQPDKIAEAIRLFSDVKLWQNVALQLSIPEQDVKTRLKLIVDRRNKIAHEADIDPSFPNMRWPISRSDVNQSLTYITQICESIYVAVQ